MAQANELDEALSSYRRAVESFQWELPAAFNFGHDVVDRFAAEPDRPAVFWRSAAGESRRLTFAEIAAGSNRVAHLIRLLEIAPGTPVIVMLPRVPEWQIVIVGALKAGLLVIPSSAILRPKDIAYRVDHSGAVAVIAAAESTDAVDRVRAELVSVKHFLCLNQRGGSAPDGWTDLSDALASMPDDASAGHPTRATDPALVYYTSGWTPSPGRP